MTGITFKEPLFNRLSLFMDRYFPFLSKQRIVYFLSSEVFLFGVILLLMLFRFGGIFRNEGLPGWDTSSHFYAVLQEVEYLKQGHIAGYTLDWLGGMPLFLFYAPFFFVLVAITWIITSSLIPLFLLFRIFIFIGLFGVTISFWFFVKTFFGRKVARWSIPLSLFYVFYPKLLSLVGVGAGGTIWVGLVPHTYGLIFLFLWISFLHRITFSRSPIPIILTAFFTALTAFTHTISFVTGIIAFFVYLFCSFRGFIALRRVFMSLIIGLLLAGFWLFPFLQHISLSSSEAVAASSSIRDPFMLLFPFNPAYLFNVQTVSYFRYWAFFLFLTTLLGMYFLTFRGRQFFLPAVFGVFFIFFVRDYFPVIFPSIRLHYQRFAPFLFFIMLAVAAYGCHLIFTHLTSHTRRKTLFIFVFALLILESVLQFDLGSDGFRTPRINEELASHRSSIPWSWNDEQFELSSEAKHVLNILKTIPGAQRIFVQMPSVDGLALIGSLHYFSSEIPFRNQQSTIQGLYVESAPLTPFIMPLIDSLTDGKVQIWGDHRLTSVESFTDQFNAHLDRLRTFGTSHIVAYSPSFQKNLLNATGTRLIQQTENFDIFELSKPRPLVYSSPYIPAIYFDTQGTLPFRDVALALYASSSTFRFPVLQGTFDITRATDKDLAPYSLILINGPKLTYEEVVALGQFHHPVVILNPSENLFEDSRFDTLSNVLLVEHFDPLEHGLVYESSPYGWEDLHSIFSYYSDSYTLPQKNVRLLQFDDNSIQLEGKGPVIVNAGYSPYWRNASCKERDCQVFRVTPDQMLVFANGTTTLTYEADAAKKVFIIISYVTFLSVLGYIAYIFLKRPRPHNTSSIPLQN